MRATDSRGRGGAASSVVKRGKKGWGGGGGEEGGAFLGTKSYWRHSVRGGSDGARDKKECMPQLALMRVNAKKKLLGLLFFGLVCFLWGGCVFVCAEQNGGEGAVSCYQERECCVCCG